MVAAPSRRHAWLRLIVVAVVVLAACLLAVEPKAAAACAALPTDKGTVTQTVTVPATGSYRVWSRMMVPDTTNTSFYLQIDSTLCGAVIGGGSAIPANSWTWVDYQNGTTSSTVDVSLTAGTHLLTMAGKDANVAVDRIILTADTTCVPTGTGDNCANPPDTTPPTVSITAPTSGAAVSGTTTVTASAADDVGVVKVELYVDGTLTQTDTTAPYSFNLNTASLSVGTHTLVAKAYDAAGNSSPSAAVTVTVGNVTYIPEDINMDGQVNLLDFSLLSNKYGQSGSGLGRVDINGDGTVNLLDFSLLSAKYGT